MSEHTEPGHEGLHPNLKEFEGDMSLPLDEQGHINPNRLDETKRAAIESGPGWMSMPAPQDEARQVILDHRFSANFPAFFAPGEGSRVTAFTYVGGKNENMPQVGQTPTALLGGDARRQLSKPYQRFAMACPEYCQYVLNIESEWQKKLREGDDEWCRNNREVREDAILGAYRAMARFVDRQDPAIETIDSGDGYDQRYLLR